MSFGKNLLIISEAYKAIEDAGVDKITRYRLEDKNVIPGALWHIYQARDAGIIRDFLNKVGFY